MNVLLRWFVSEGSTVCVCVCKQVNSCSRADMELNDGVDVTD